MLKVKLNYVLIMIIVIAFLFGFIYYMKEKFAVMVYDPNIRDSPTPSPVEQQLINKIVNDVESCFNPNYTTTLSTTDLNNFTNEFRTKWINLIKTGIKNKVYYNDSLSLMKKYYQNIIDTLINNYCNQTNDNYYDFDVFYTTEMTKIVDDLECLIKKLKIIIHGSSYNEIIVDKQELLYQVKCIQNLVYNGLSNSSALSLRFYEELYNIVIKSVENNGYNFCDEKVKDVDYNSTKIVRLNAPLKKPGDIRCKDLSNGFIIPTTIINPSGVIIKGQSLLTPPSGSTPTPTSISASGSTPTPTSGSTSGSGATSGSTPTPTSGSTSGSGATSGSTPTPTSGSVSGSGATSGSASGSGATSGSVSGSGATSGSVSGSGATSGSASGSASGSGATSGSASGSGSTGGTPVTTPPPTTSSSSSTSSNSPQTVPYVASLANMPTSYTDTSNLGIEPANMEDYALLASNQYFPMQPDINLSDAKGPNNFFIPNIWIEEYK
jgi:hypothetical protein